MVNFNGTIVPDSQHSFSNNRAFLYGDGIFETVKVLDGRVLFLEDHYFRLMAGMRIIRMEIPMDFTMEYFEAQLLAVAKANNCMNAARARMTVYRNPGGFYLPQDATVSYLAVAQPLPQAAYAFDQTEYEVDLYKDFFISAQLLSSIKSTNRLLNVTGSIFAEENGLQNCLLLNEAKNVAEALNGNLFLLTGDSLITPPVADGCVNGVMRKQILAIAKRMENLQVTESPISAFELQKADELFVTNVILGIRPITRYRKKEYGSALAQQLLIRLNAQIRLA